MGTKDRSWRPQFYAGIAAALIGLMCLAIGVSNKIGALATVALVALLVAVVAFIAALWGYLARNRA